jgi:hypothetical protein
MNKNWKLLVGSTWILQEGKTIVAQVIHHGTHSPLWRLEVGGQRLGDFNNPEAAKQWAHKALGFQA